MIIGEMRDIRTNYVVSFSLIYVFISDVYCRTGWIVD